MLRVVELHKRDGAWHAVPGGLEASKAHPAEALPPFGALLLQAFREDSQLRPLAAVHDFSEPAHLALAPERLQGAVGSPPAAGSPPVPSSSQPAAAGPGGSERGAEAAGSQDATQCSPGAAAACSSQIIPDSPADQSPLLQLAARAAEGVPVDEGGGTQPQPQPSSPPAFSLLPLGGTQVVAISPPAPLEPPPEHAEHQLGGQQQPHEAPEQSKVESAAAGAAAAALPAPVPVAEQPLMLPVQGLAVPGPAPGPEQGAAPPQPSFPVAAAHHEFPPPSEEPGSLLGFDVVIEAPAAGAAGLAGAAHAGFDYDLTQASPSPEPPAGWAGPQAQRAELSLGPPPPFPGFFPEPTQQLEPGPFEEAAPQQPAQHAPTAIAAQHPLPPPQPPGFQLPPQQQPRPPQQALPPQQQPSYFGQHQMPLAPQQAAPWPLAGIQALHQAAGQQVMFQPLPVQQQAQQPQHQQQRSSASAMPAMEQLLGEAALRAAVRPPPPACTAAGMPPPHATVPAAPAAAAAQGPPRQQQLVPPAAAPPPQPAGASLAHHTASHVQPRGAARSGIAPAAPAHAWPPEPRRASSRPSAQGSGGFKLPRPNVTKNTTRGVALNRQYQQYQAQYQPRGPRPGGGDGGGEDAAAKARRVAAIQAAMRADVEAEEPPPLPSEQALLKQQAGSAGVGMASGGPLLRPPPFGPAAACPTPAAPGFAQCNQAAGVGPSRFGGPHPFPPQPNHLAGPEQPQHSLRSLFMAPPGPLPSAMPPLQPQHQPQNHGYHHQQQQSPQWPWQQAQGRQPPPQQPQQPGMRRPPLPPGFAAAGARPAGPQQRGAAPPAPRAAVAEPSTRPTEADDALPPQLAAVPFGMFVSISSGSAYKAWAAGGLGKAAKAAALAREFQAMLEEDAGPAVPAGPGGLAPAAPALLPRPPPAAQAALAAAAAGVGQEAGPAVGPAAGSASLSPVGSEPSWSAEPLTARTTECLLAAEARVAAAASVAALQGAHSTRQAAAPVAGAPSGADDPGSDAPTGPTGQAAMQPSPGSGSDPSWSAEPFTARTAEQLFVAEAAAAAAVAGPALDGALSGCPMPQAVAQPAAPAQAVPRPSSSKPEGLGLQPEAGQSIEGPGSGGTGGPPAPAASAQAETSGEGDAAASARTDLPAAEEGPSATALPAAVGSGPKAVNDSGPCSLGTEQLLAMDALEAQWRAQQAQRTQRGPSSLGKRSRSSAETGPNEEEEEERRGSPASPARPSCSQASTQPLGESPSGAKLHSTGSQAQEGASPQHPVGAAEERSAGGPVQGQPPSLPPQPQPLGAASGQQQRGGGAAGPAAFAEVQQQQQHVAPQVEAAEPAAPGEALPEPAPGLPALAAPAAPASVFPFQLASGKQLAGVSPSKLQAVLSLFGEGGSASPQPPQQDEGAAAEVADNAAAEALREQRAARDAMPAATAQPAEEMPGSRARPPRAPQPHQQELPPAEQPQQPPPGMVACPFTTGHKKGSLMVSAAKMSAMAAFFGDEGSVAAGAVVGEDEAAHDDSGASDAAEEAAGAGQQVAEPLLAPPVLAAPAAPASLFPFQLASGKQLARVSPSKLRAALALFGEDRDGSPEPLQDDEEGAAEAAAEAAAQGAAPDVTPAAPGLAALAAGGGRAVAITVQRALGAQETPGGGPGGSPSPPPQPRQQEQPPPGMVACPFTTGHKKGSLMVSAAKMKAMTTFFGDEGGAAGGAAGGEDEMGIGKENAPDVEEGAAPGAARAAGATVDATASSTPLLRKQLLKSRLGSESPRPPPAAAAAPGADKGAGPSRLGPGAGAASGGLRKGRPKFKPPASIPANKRFKHPSRQEMTTPATSSLGPSRLAVNTGSHSPAVQLHDLQHSAAKSIISQARGTPSPPAQQQQEQEQQQGKAAAAVEHGAGIDAGPMDVAAPAAASGGSDPAGLPAAAAGKPAGAAGDSSAALLPQAAAHAEGAAPSLPPAPASSMPLQLLPLDSQAAATYLLSDDQPASAALAQQLGAQELRERLLAAGANPSYATEAWAANHYRWVVWKLARLELAHGEAVRGRLLSARVVLDELKARYEREFNRGQAPLLKRVLQHDEAPSCLMVLLVAQVHCPPPQQQPQHGKGAAVQLELTDGWYWIKGVCDEPLSQLARAGKIAPGDKLRICGAELESNGPGEPLDAARSAVLKLGANGTHKVSSDSKLGRQRGRTIVPLSAVRPDGGVIPRTLVVVHRILPRLMWIKMPSGVIFYQTERRHQAAQQRADADISKVEADVLAQVQREDAAECRSWLAHDKRGGLSTGQQLYARWVTEQGGECCLSQGLNATEQKALTRFHEQRVAELDRRRQELLQGRMQTLSRVPEVALPTLFLLVGEVAHRGPGGRGRRDPAQALIIIRKPSEELEAQLREGEIYSVTGLEPDGVAMRTGELGGSPPLKLRAGKHTHWEPLDGAALRQALVWNELPRQQLSLGGLLRTASGACFDFAGVVLKAGPCYQAERVGDYYQWVFLGDASIPVPATAGSAAADAEGTAQHGRQQPARPPGTARSAGGRKRKLGSGAPEQAQQRGKQGLEQQQQPAAVEAAEAWAAGTASGHAAGAAAAAADAAMADAAPPAEGAQGAAAAAAGGGIESGVQLAAAAAEQQGDGSESAGAPMEAEGAEPAEEAGCKQASGAADAGCAAVAAPEGPAAAEAAPAGAAAQAALAGGGEAGAAGVSEAPHAAERQPEAVAAAPPLETAGSPAGLPEAVAGGTTAGVAPAAEAPPAFDPRAPWLLAVKLEGPAESINWLDPASDEGVVVAFRDLVLTGSDASVRLWNARGSLRTEIARVRGGGMAYRGGRRGAADSGTEAAARVADWAAANDGVVRQLRHRIADMLGVQ